MNSLVRPIQFANRCKINQTNKPPSIIHMWVKWSWKQTTPTHLVLGISDCLMRPSTNSSIFRQLGKPTLSELSSTTTMSTMFLAHAARANHGVSVRAGVAKSDRRWFN